MKLEKKDLKILFLGTPLIAQTVLKGLFENGYQISCLVTQEDKPFGRKGKLKISECKEFALEKNIPFFQPHRLRKEWEYLKNIDFNLIICIAYGQIIPDEVLSLAKYGAYNLHGSLLPKYRGAAPMQRAIMNKEKETGVTLMKMVKEMDAGEMYDKLSFKIDEDDNYSSVALKMGEVATKLLLKNLLPLVNKEIKGIAQDEKEVTFANKILPPDEHLPLNLSVIDTLAYINALSETPGAYVILNRQKLKIFKARAKNYLGSLSIGSLLFEKNSLSIILKDGAIEILDLQLEGKKRMPSNAFLNGYRGEKEGLFVS